MPDTRLTFHHNERIGDHAVNISERVQYMVTGALPDHGTSGGDPR